MGFLSALGGPLYLADRLKPSWGLKVAFAVNFAPVALLIFGAFALSDDPLSRFTRASVRAGVL